MWGGRIDRFDWKLIGKQEMLIQYNVNRAFNAMKDSDFVGSKHLNPDYVRWELHRAWVVEATVRAGQRHRSPRARYYFDEDTWLATLADRWDAKGQLWKLMWGLPYVAPDMPGVSLDPNGFYDLANNSFFVNDIPAEFDDAVRFGSPPKGALFTPESLSADGVR